MTARAQFSSDAASLRPYKLVRENISGFLSALSRSLPRFVEQLKSFLRRPGFHIRTSYCLTLEEVQELAAETGRSTEVQKILLVGFKAVLPDDSAVPQGHSVPPSTHQDYQLTPIFAIEDRTHHLDFGGNPFKELRRLMRQQD